MEFKQKYLCLDHPHENNFANCVLSDNTNKSSCQHCSFSKISLHREKKEITISILNHLRGVPKPDIDRITKDHIRHGRWYLTVQTGGYSVTCVFIVWGPSVLLQRSIFLSQSPPYALQSSWKIWPLTFTVKQLFALTQSTHGCYGNLICMAQMIPEKQRLAPGQVHMERECEDGNTDSRLDSVKRNLYKTGGDIHWQCWPMGYHVLVGQKWPMGFNYFCVDQWLHKDGWHDELPKSEVKWSKNAP